jgi:pilus assembly protein CpaF
MFLNIIITIAILGVAFAIITKKIKDMQNAKVVENVVVDDKTYTLEKMIDFVKRRLDEKTKVNLFDLGLSEEELKRRKNKK